MEALQTAECLLDLPAGDELFIVVSEVVVATHNSDENAVFLRTVQQ